MDVAANSVVYVLLVLLHIGCFHTRDGLSVYDGLLLGPSRRLAPIIKCNAFLCFQSYVVRDISLTEIYRWLVNLGVFAEIYRWFRNLK